MGSSTAVFTQAISFPSILTLAGARWVVTLLPHCVRALAASTSATAWRFPGLARPAGPVESLLQIRRLRTSSAIRTCPHRRRFPAPGEVRAAPHQRPPFFFPDGIFILSTR